MVPNSDPRDGDIRVISDGEQLRSQPFVSGRRVAGQAVIPRFSPLVRGNDAMRFPAMH